MDVPANPKAQRSQSEGAFFIDCPFSVMPQTVPPSGHIYVLPISERQSGDGVADYFAPAGSSQKWNDEGVPVWAYRCELTNYSIKVALNVSLRLHLRFRSPEKVEGQEHSWREGAVTSEADRRIVVPKIDIGTAASYVFYIWNCCLYRSVRVSIPNYVFVDSDAPEAHQVQLKQSATNFFQTLPPVESGQSR